jgi:DNA-binding NarL/FixJ family response regulator
MATNETGRAMVATFPVANLTTREYRCLALAAEGLTNKAIAGQLESIETRVTLALSDAYRRLGLASSRDGNTRAAAIAMLTEEQHRLADGGFRPDVEEAA